MAESVEIGRLYQVKMFIQCGAQCSTNVFHLLCVDATGIRGTVPQLADAFIQKIDQDLKTILPTQATILGCTAQRLPYGGFTRGLLWLGQYLGTAGTNTSNVLPTYTCGLTKWIAETAAGRHRWGHTFWPFPCEDLNDQNGEPNAAYVTLMDTIAVLMQTSFVAGTAPNTSDCVLVLYDRVNNTQATINEAVTKEKWGRQKRRGPYGRTEVGPF